MRKKKLRERNERKRGSKRRRIYENDQNEYV